MIRFNRFNQRAALCALLLCFSLSAAADEIQDANKPGKRGQQAQALGKIDTLNSSQPKEAQARFLKGVSLTEQGQVEEAIRVFTGLTQDYPELPEPYNNLAVLYAGQGQYDKAKLALEKAIRTHPSYSTAHENLGDIYAKMASQAYDRALQLDRSNTSSKTKLTLIKDLYIPAVKIASTKTHVASVAPPPVTPPADPVTVAAVTPAISIATSVPVVTSTELTPVKPVVAATSSNSSDDVLKALQDWARAWSSRNANKYLSMYAKTFITPNKEPRSSWEKQRRERIGKPQPIVVTISNAKVKLVDDAHASVSFVQSYHSGSLKSTTRKSMEMIKANGAWQIQSEQAGTKR